MPTCHDPIHLHLLSLVTIGAVAAIAHAVALPHAVPPAVSTVSGPPE
jgi:hypothetical protein